MSLIRLRAQMRRRRRHAAAATVLLMLTALVAAHHGGLPESHGGAHGTPLSITHAGHDAPAPASELDAAFAACLAVLPFLILFAATAAARFRAPWLLPALGNQGAGRHTFAAPVARRSRAGPCLLCVMRC